MKYLFFLFCLLTSSLYSENLTSRTTEAVKAHLILSDPQSALNTIYDALQQEPNNTALLRLELSSLACQGNIDTLLKRYKNYQAISENSFEPVLLEEISWAIIKKAHISSSSNIRKEALISAFLTNEARSIPIFLNALDDPSNEVRLTALKLAARLRDDTILERIFTHFTTTKSLQERLTAIQTLAHSHYPKLNEKLEDLLQESYNSLDEKLAAIYALTTALEQNPTKELLPLFTSNRAHLRAAACQLVAQQQKYDLLEHVFLCLHDPCQIVRLSALQTIGLMASQNQVELRLHEFTHLQNHVDPETALLASWVLLIHNKQDLAAGVFKRALVSSDVKTACFAASCIAHAGPQGLSLALWGVRQEINPFVSINLASALVWQRKELELAQEIIFSFLSHKHERISWSKDSLFTFIGKANDPHPAAAESDDLLARLDLIHLLACCNCPHLQNLLKPLLNERTWGITWHAAHLLICEGNDLHESLSALLNDDNPHVSIQAACILAYQAQDENALRLFKNQYPLVSRQLKEQILMSLAQIGQKQMIPFLVEALDEPFESLRISAARAILLCLEH